ncbi:hypothetical protein ig2599ANME_1837 [groundwater metagenome]
MTDIIVPAKVHGRTLELTDSPTNFGFAENEELIVVIKKKIDSVVEKTAGKEMDEDLINTSVELTELGE